MRLSDPTHLYEGGLSERADRASRAVSVITHAPFLSAFMFVLLGLTSDDPAVAAATIVVSLLTATVIPVLVVQHYSVRYGNTDAAGRHTVVCRRGRPALRRRGPGHMHGHDAQLRPEHRRSHADKHEVEDQHPCDRRHGACHGPVRRVLAVGPCDVRPAATRHVESLRQGEAHASAAGRRCGVRVRRHRAGPVGVFVMPICRRHHRFKSAGTIMLILRS